jgi:hypothetical protein
MKAAPIMAPMAPAPPKTAAPPKTLKTAALPETDAPLKNAPTKGSRKKA